MNRFFKFRRDAKFCVSTALMLLMLCCFHAPAFADLNTGLVAYYSFDDCTPTDNNSHGHNGTAIGSPQCENSTIKGKTFAFNGIDNSFKINSSPDFDIQTNASFSVWIKPEKLPASARSYILNKWVGAGEDKGFYLLPSGKVGFILWTCTLSSSFELGSLASKSMIPLNVWTHITATYDGNKAKIYINGVLDSELTTNSGCNVNDSSGAYYIADNPERRKLEGLSSSPFQGRIDEVRIYNRTLADTEIMELSVSPADVLGGFVDLKQSRINYADNTITLKFTKPFNDFIYDFDKINIPLGLTQPQYGLADIQPLMQADNSVTLPLQNLQNNADKLIRVSFIQGNKAVKATLMGVADQVNSFNPNPIVNLQDPNPIINLRTVAETKPTSAIVCSNQQGIKSACNNFFNSTENGANPSKIAVFRDTLSHRLIDFDKIVPNAQINKGTWAKTNYRKTLGGDNGRIPLLLIHGWQGDKDLRNPAKLGLWENSELQYWQHFLDYYLTSDNPDGVRNLQKKYHIYLYHYPSYKHVTYNASVLTAMLKELATKNPTSDLNQAMQTGGKGVAVLAHSMGGLVARSAIEEYQAFGANGEKLRRLITLDTPHHGSPVSQPVTWEQFQTKLAQIFIKDPYTQGASDLNWDNFNGFYAAADVNTNNQKRWDNTLAKNHAAFA